MLAPWTKEAAEAAAVARRRAAQAQQVDAGAVQLVKANELTHRSRLARIDKLERIYKKNNATHKLEEVAGLRAREGTRYRSRRIELDTQLGGDVVERILLSFKRETPTPPKKQR